MKVLFISATVVSLVICSVVVCSLTAASASPPQSSSPLHGLLRVANRRLPDMPLWFTPAQLSLWVLAELGRRPPDNVPNEALEQDELLKLTSSVFDKPGLIILGFLPSDGESSLPPGIFDDEMSPFYIDASTKRRDCADTDLKCLRDSTLEFVLDKKSELIAISENVEFVQWSNDAEDLSVSKAVIDAMKTSLEDVDVHENQLTVLRQINDANVAEIVVDEDNHLFTVLDGDNQVPFLFSDTCSRALMAELAALEVLQVSIPELITEKSGPQVLILSPTRALKCFSATAGDDSSTALQYSAAHLMLLRMVGQLIASTEKSTDGKVSSLITFAKDDLRGAKVNPLRTNPDDLLDSASMVEIEARRKLQAASTAAEPSQAADQTPESTSTPRMVVFWLSVALVIALIMAIIPLLKLSTINDPIISSKLFAPIHAS